MLARTLLIAAVLTMTTGVGWSETILEFRSEMPAIMVPIKPSTAREAHFSRVITFIGCNAIDFKQDWADQDLSVIKRGNTIEVKLQNPQFSTTLNVFGDNGIVYPLMVYASDKQETLPSEVSIVLSKDRNGANADPGANLPEPIDSQMVAITKHVYGFKPQSGVMESPDYDRDALAKGEKRIGRLVYESDAFVMKSIRIYRYKQVAAYMVVDLYRGDKLSVFQNFEELKIPRGLGKLPRTMDFLDPKFPGMLLKRNQPRIVYFFEMVRN